jgi:hypothetical protein
MGVQSLNALARKPLGLSLLPNNPQTILDYAKSPQAKQQEF